MSVNNLPTILQFEGQDVRIVDQYGDPWWVLADLCRVLEIRNPSDAASRLDDDEKLTLDSAEGQGGPGIPQATTIVSEPGLYRLLRTSRKPIARRLDRWVCHEVLPSIRKTGGYGTGTQLTAEQFISGLKEAIAPLAVRFDGQDQAIEKIDANLSGFKAEVVGEINGLKGQVGSILKIIHNRRREVSKADKEEHFGDILIISGGLCPCGCGRRIVDENGIKNAFAEVDHHYSSSAPSIYNTWPLHSICHNELTTGRVQRTERDAPFRAYQEARKRLPGKQGRLF